MENHTPRTFSFVLRKQEIKTLRTYHQKAPESSVDLKQLAESQPDKCKTKCKQ